MSKYKVVKRTIRDVEPGELVTCPMGNEHKVLDRRGDVVTVSECGLFSRFGFLYNIEDMVLLKYKLKDQETEKDELDELSEHIRGTIWSTSVDKIVVAGDVGGLAEQIAKAIRENYKITKKE